MNNDELQDWFEANKSGLESAYLTGQHPWQQSGVGLRTNRTAEEWEAWRRPVADCLDRSGTFLDIGCANGYLLQCVMQWVWERGIEIIPYGLDLSEKLVALAQERLPEYAGHMFVGNAWSWIPHHTFDYVRTELVYVPDELHKLYVNRLLELYLQPNGKLLTAEYRSHENKEPSLTIDQYLTSLGLTVDSVQLGTWNGLEYTRIAVIKKTSK